MDRFNEEPFPPRRGPDPDEDGWTPATMGRKGGQARVPKGFSKPELRDRAAQALRRRQKDTKRLEYLEAERWVVQRLLVDIKFIWDCEGWTKRAQSCGDVDPSPLYERLAAAITPSVPPDTESHE